MTPLVDLPTLWAFIIAFAVFAYVVMDGFDLGIGILFPVFAPGPERDSAMNTVAPVWDGNETWLVLGGGGLSAGLCHHPAGPLRADHCHGAGADLPRRGLRVPLA
jgi:cytochrome bd-type quinol oxidase subunit 2